MRLISFSCKELNSFINRKIDFFPDVSFLHGINGSGKTTILRAIASLLTPDPVWLFNASFSAIEVRLDHNNQEFIIGAYRGETSALTIKITGGIDLEDTISPDDIRLVGKFAEE